MSALPPFAAVVVAAGQGLRAGQPVPKQFALWRGKPLVRHSVEALIAAGASPVVVAIPAGGEAVAREALGGLDVTFVTGGATRQQSVARALQAVHDSEIVLVHDAARPNIAHMLMKRLIDALNTCPGAIPVLPVTDSIAIAENDMMAGSADRGLAGDHLGDVETRTVAAHERAERHVGDPRHRREHDRAVDPHRTDRDRLERRRKGNHVHGESVPKNRAAA